MPRRLWNDEELTAVLSLYCQLPFGKMHARNPTVIALAGHIDRSASAVALKLVNFASLDPELKDRGVAGMSNVSASDKKVWSRYYGQWDMLSDASLVDAVETTTSNVSRSRQSNNTEVKRLTKTRRGQSFFRAAVLAAYEWRCCITGIASLELLRASHIVPWSRDETLRLEPRNGLCLNALHDAAFDRGLITLGDSMELQISSRLQREIPRPSFEELFEQHVGKPIHLPERFKPDLKWLERHRMEVFQN